MIELLMVEIGNPWIAILGGIAAVATAVGAQKWLPELLSKKKSKGQSDCEKNIAKLTSALRILLPIVKQSVIENPGMIQAIDEAEAIVQEITIRYKINE